MASLLDNIPDLTDWADISKWVEDGLAQIAAEKSFPGALTALSMPDIGDGDPVLGVYGSSEWRKFALGIFLADWACYTKPEDRADFARMLSVTAAFPKGFRLYFCALSDGTQLPVGYTGWYPISENIFNVLEKNPAQITHRGFMVPLKETSKDGNYIYLFNYSIVPQLIGSEHSKTLIRDFAASIGATPQKGISAVTVSAHGIKVAEKFGMTCSGQMSHDGDIENVYIKRGPAPQI